MNSKEQYVTREGICRWPRVGFGGFINCEPTIGLVVYKRNPHTKSKYHFVGEVSKLVKNPFTNNNGFLIKGNNESIYPIKGVYAYFKK